MTSPKVRRGFLLDRLVEFSPSVGWFYLMVLPVLFQYRMFHPTGRDFQFTMVVAIGLSLLAADYLCYRMDPACGPIWDNRAVHVERILIGLCFVVPVAAHLYMMPQIPLLSVLVDNDTGNQSLTQLRDDSAKFLDVPSIVKYLFNWALFVFAPIFIAMSVFAGRRFQALAGFVLACTYALATLAKFPLVLLVLACLFALCLLPTDWQRRLVIGLIAAVLAGFLATGAWLMSGALAEFDGSHNQVEPVGLATMNGDDPRRALSYGDNMRLAPKEPQPTLSIRGFERALTYVFYRVWLTPSDVSNRWYQYFTYVAAEGLGLQFLQMEPRTAMTKTPSRLVGVWAYESRFPDKYAETINANASFDADAFAHGGVIGVVIATLLLLGVRVGTAWLMNAPNPGFARPPEGVQENLGAARRFGNMAPSPGFARPPEGVQENLGAARRFLVRPHPVALAAYGVMLCLMSVLPSSASIQAMFGANGLFVIPVIVAVLYVSRRGRGRLGDSG